MIWKPKFGDMYYVITIYGGVSSMKWADDNYDRSVYEVGNCFKTREAALFEVERRRVIKELEDFAEEHNDPFDWEFADHKEKCFIYYDYYRKVLEIDFRYITKYHDIYFSSEEIAKQAIAKVGEERIKKYYLGVDDE